MIFLILDSECHHSQSFCLEYGLGYTILSTRYFFKRSCQSSSLYIGVFCVFKLQDHTSRTCDHPFTSSGALLLNHRILVGDRPVNYHVLVAIGLHIPLGLKCRNCGTLVKKTLNFEPTRGINRCNEAGIFADSSL